MASETVANPGETELHAALSEAMEALWLTHGLLGLVQETAAFQSDGFDAGIYSAVRASRERVGRAIAAAGGVL